MDKREKQDRYRLALENYKRKHPGKPLPLSRREFIAHGLIEGTAVVMLPKMLNELFRVTNAFAETTAMPAFIQIQCDGGPALAGNALPFGVNGAYVPPAAITRFGAAANVASAGGQLVTPFGAPTTGPGFTFLTASKIRAGLLDGATGLTAAELACVQGVGVACNTQDDDGGSNNATMLGAALAQIGLVGSISAQASDRQGPSGAQRAGVFVNDTKFNPLFVSRVSDFVNAAKVANPFTGLDAPNLLKVVQGVRDLSSSQLQKLSALPDAEKVRVISQEAFDKNVGSLANAPVVDVRADTALAPIFNGVTAATADNNQDAIYGTIVKNVLEGRLGSAAWDIGGCDYHDDPITSTDAKDLEIGTRIRQAIRAAITLNRKTVIAVTSNGNVIGRADRSNWDGDKGDMSYYYMFLVTPPGTAKPAQRIAQLGAYNTGGAAITNNGVGGQNGLEAARAMMINYMVFAGKPIAEIQRRFPELTLAFIQSVIAIG